MSGARQPAAHVTTFYSFKGGVGRTMLLANVGALLARKRRVLLWDLDLEAPGMHHIPGLRPAELPRDGFLEWMVGWQAAAGSPVDAEVARSLCASVRPVPGFRDLAILPAFGEGADFAALYQAIDWTSILVTQPERGIALFRGLVRELAASGAYDHVLVDARTGITDLGGILAAILPDVTVLVGSYGHQNTHGLLHVKAALEPAAEGRVAERGDAPPLRVLLVASPVPSDEPERVERRRGSWDELFRVRPIAEVAFDRRLLFGEELLAVTDPVCGAAQAYEKVAAHVAELRAEQVAERDRAAREAERGRAGGSGAGGRGAELAFEARVARLFSLAGFDVSPAGARDGGVDFVAERAGFLSTERLHAECRVKVTDPAVVARVRRAVPPGARGVIVAESFAEAVRRAAEPDVALVTPMELERQLFDPTPYLTRLRTAFESSELARTYVAQRVVREEAPAEPVEMLPHAHAWARGVGRRLWLVLGDYGTGKPAFFRRFAYELAVRALEDPAAPFPIAIDLKDFPTAISMEGLLQEHLRATIGWHGNPASILHLIASGRAVVLLDAFDEMGAAAAGRSVEEQFRQLAALAGAEPLAEGGNRVLITCRTHFFRDQQQVKDAALMTDGPRDSALGRVARDYAATIDELALLSSEQVDAFLTAHLGEGRAKEARAFIDRTYDLGSLAPRPVLLEMSIGSLPTLMAGGAEVTVAGLYETYTRQWLNDRSGGHLRTPPDLRARLLGHLARYLWDTEQQRIHHRDLLGVLRGWPEPLFRGLDLDRVDLELRTAAFLTRTADAHYGFSHKSFLEFFLAKHIVAAVADGRVAEALPTRRLTPEVSRFVWELCRTSATGMVGALRGVLGGEYRQGISENALRLAAFGFGTGVAEARDVGRGARLEGAVFVEEDLRGMVLIDANLSKVTFVDCNLRGARIGGAVLHQSSFSKGSLESAMLDGADLTGAALHWTKMAKASLRRVVAVGVWFEGCDLSRAALHAAVLTEPRFDRCTLMGVAWSDARLDGARFEGCIGPPPPGFSREAGSSSNAS